MTVLLVNPAYPPTFWSMNVVLKRLKKKLLEPPLGLITLAALLPKDWDIRLIELTARDITEEEWRDADIVMISGMGVQSAGISAAIKEAKRRGKTVVVGGPWAFHIPQAAFEAGADIVVKGEAELVIPELLDALRRKESKIVIEASGKPNLEECPPPRFDLLDFSLYAQMDIQFSRGCPFMCEFCDITLMFGRRVRTKTPQQIIGELQTLYDLGWRKYIFFVDDNFIGNPPRARALLKEMVPWMRAHGMPYELCTQASVNLAAHPDIMEMMVDAGFYKVFLGIETPDKDSLRLTKKHQNAATDLDEVCRVITVAGLQIIAGCVLGFDNEPAGAGDRLLEFADRNHIPEMFVTMLQVGPGTGLYNRLKKEGRLLPENWDEEIGSQTGMINFIPTRPAGEIVNEFIDLYDKLYQPEAFFARTFHHLAGMTRPPVKRPFALPTHRERCAVGITFWRQGFLYPSRRVFWKYFFKALAKFPQRIPQYVSSCIMAEHYFEFRETIKTKLQGKLPVTEGECEIQTPAQAQCG
jgi:radical SAM superfamily enzyme YgiQ (UPF0313 family)